jgi:hypothetical protein
MPSGASFTAEQETCAASYRPFVSPALGGGISTISLLGGMGEWRRDWLARFDSSAAAFLFLGGRVSFFLRGQVGSGRGYGVEGWLWAFRLGVRQWQRTGAEYPIDSAVSCVHNNCSPHGRLFFPHLSSCASTASIPFRGREAKCLFASAAWSSPGHCISCGTPARLRRRQALGLALKAPAHFLALVL